VLNAKPEPEHRPEAGDSKGCRVESEDPETRTTAVATHSERMVCCRCGRAIQGRRRNGYCSDRCRMQDQRARRSARIQQLLSAVEESVAALRAAIESDHANR
jgi:hypothetical protein